jgi:hypothetical protein
MIKCINEGAVGLFQTIQQGRGSHILLSQHNASGPSSLFMIRHTQTQMYSGTTTSLMSLFQTSFFSSQSEWDIFVERNDEEKEESDALGKQAQKFFNKAVEKKLAPNGAVTI